MAFYEHVFLSRQDLTQAQIDQMTEQYKGVIEAQGGKVGRVEQWGLRPLAYRMQKNRKAYYTLMQVDAPVTAMAEVERQMSLSENVLRFLTLKTDKLIDAASPMMNKGRDRDDRYRDRDEDRPRRPRRPRGEQRNANTDNAGNKGE